MVWHADAPQGNEAAKIKHLIVPYTRGRVLDIGCGAYKAFPHFVGLDNGKQWGKPVTDITGDGADLSMFADQSFDGIFSSHFLEHVDDYKAALKEWWRVIKRGGHLTLYLPHKDFYPNIGQSGANPDHKHDFLPDDIIDAMEQISKSGGCWDLLENEARNGRDEYSMFLVFRKQMRGDT